jgi:hypothetical protein
MSKGDLPDVRDAWEGARDSFRGRGVDLKLVSAATGQGVRELIVALWQSLGRETGQPSA